MEKEKNTNQAVQESTNNLQDYLSIAYIYILLLGIVSNLIYYHFFDINIVNYSSVLDVLLSPFSVMSDSIYLLTIILISPILSWIYFFYQSKTLIRNQQVTDKALPQKEYELKITAYKGLKMLVPALFIFGLFIGASIGKGLKTSKKIKNKEHKIDHFITFTDGQQDSIKIIGQNSQYIFYAFPQQSSIHSSPIQGNIKRLEKIKKH